MSRILMADDDECFRSLIAGELRRLGHEVTELENGADALELLAESGDGLKPMPDLVLLDVCMPRYSGLGVLSLMHRFEKPPPTFIITSFTDPSVDDFASRLGATRVFHKPTELDQLMDAIEASLRPTN